MKKLCVWVFFALFFMHCAEKEEPKTVSIKLHYNLGETLVKPLRIFDTREQINYEETPVVASAMPDSSSIAYFEFPFQGEGLILIRGGEIYSPIYVKAGGNLEITFSEEDIENRSPQGSLAPYYAFQEQTNKAALFKLEKAFYELDGKAYETLMRSSYDSLMEKLQQDFQSAGDREFIDFQQIRLLMRLHELAHDFPAYKSYFVDTDEEILPLSIKDSLDQIVLNLPASYLNHIEVKQAFFRLYSEKIMKEMRQLGEVSIDERIQFYKKTRVDAMSSFTQSHILEYLKAQYIQEELSSFEMEKALEALLKFRETYPASIFISNLEYQQSKRGQLAKGNPAPDIKGVDTLGNGVSLSDFKGKVVYVDVWATWCGPCRQEFPFSKKLKTEFEGQKDVAFMYVSIDDDKEDWLKYLKKDPEFEGEHLFVEGGWDSQVSESYMIEGIPRYILIDKEGKIVAANASRPSSGDKIKEEIKALL
jgi:thiol-disulfide isomerase/thioredoxin